MKDFMIGIGVTMVDLNGNPIVDPANHDKTDLMLSPYARLEFETEDGVAISEKLSPEQARLIGQSFIEAAEAATIDLALIMFLLDTMGMSIDQVEQVMGALYERRKRYIQAMADEPGRVMEEQDGYREESRDAGQSSGE